MKVVFSFDDGRIDAYDAALILSKYCLQGSFHITTGFVDGTFLTDDFGVGRKPLTFDMIRKMLDLGMEISSHGDKHIMDDSDYKDSIDKIKRYGVKDKKIGFSVPNSHYSEKALEFFVSNNRETLPYVRVGRSKRCYSFSNKIRYVLYHHGFKSYSLFKAFNKNNLISSLDKKQIISLVVKRDTKTEHICKFLKEHSDNDYILVLMFHSIVENADDEWEFLSKEKPNIKVETLKSVSYS